MTANASAWWMANPEKVYARNVKWMAAHPEKCCAYSAQWKAANPLYGTWQQMILRCTNENAANWKSYGAIGVRVCSRWLHAECGYKNFVEDMGPKPTPQHTLSRFGDVGPYSKENCAWHTPAQQGMEKRKKNLLNSLAAIAA